MLPVLVQRFPQLTTAASLHTRAVQDWLAEGRREGEAREAAKMTLRQLNRCCGPISEATIAQIQALPLEQLESLAAWLAAVG